ncbi:MAG: hypothetical protein AW10_01109 [Candidatus Accumulibacter appositus]|uniref:Uncharacterized protein n=1 Tax=Candidatus Accumulibacter appositus TaxID=1454003 RepID=A0A011PX29_9PROT|nr:MAG: hypothetical protein AW10_01109 [Candidatus Accumulibacter appositus]
MPVGATLKSVEAQPGTVVVSDSLELLPDARVRGDVEYRHRLVHQVAKARRNHSTSNLASSS